ncbi:MAG: ATP-binding protein [Chloroflexota bacterium]
MNLVTNARDAMPGGGAIEIRARCESPTGWARRATDGVVIEVSDSGEGMDDATLRRVFEPFFSTKPPGDGVGEGTGLGLPSVKFHLTRVGGTVGVVSRPGVGTTVELRIPVAVTA